MSTQSWRCLGSERCRFDPEFCLGFGWPALPIGSAATDVRNIGLRGPQ